jgi:hypothetical protein
MTYGDLSVVEKRNLLHDVLVRDGATDKQAQDTVQTCSDETVSWYLEKVFGYQGHSPVKED